MALSAWIEATIAWLYRTWNAHAGLLGALLMVGYFAAVAAVAWVYPLANWDIVAYVAAALNDGVRSAAEIHGLAWRAVEERVSAGDFLVLTADRPYRIRQYADPQAFATMLGFYETKIAYVAVIGWLSHWMQAVDAVRLISAASALAFGTTVLFWARSRGLLGHAPLILAFLAAAGFSEMARSGIPDLFAALFILLAVWSYLRGQDVLTAAALVVAVAVRPDHVAFVGVFACAALLKRQGAVAALAALAASAAAYLLIMRTSEHPGWWVQMWFTHIEYVPTLEGFSPGFSLAAYGLIVVRAVVRALVEENWLLLLLLLAAGYGRLLARDVFMEERERAVLLAGFGTILAKFAAFPLFESRFHLAYLTVIGMTLLAVAVRNAATVHQAAGPDHRAMARKRQNKLAV